MGNYIAVRIKGLDVHMLDGKSQNQNDRYNTVLFTKIKKLCTLGNTYTLRTYCLKKVHVKHINLAGGKWQWCKDEMGYIDRGRKEERRGKEGRGREDPI